MQTRQTKLKSKEDSKKEGTKSAKKSSKGKTKVQENVIPQNDPEIIVSTSDQDSDQTSLHKEATTKDVDPDADGARELFLGLM